MWSAETAKFTIQPVLLSFFFFFFFFFLIITRSGIRWSVCISKSLRILCVSFSRRDSGLCKNHLFAWSSFNFNFLHNSQWITFPTQACLRIFYTSFNGWFFILVRMTTSLHDSSKYSSRFQLHCGLNDDNIFIMIIIISPTVLTGSSSVKSEWQQIS